MESAAPLWLPRLQLYSPWAGLPLGHCAEGVASIRSRGHRLAAGPRAPGHAPPRLPRGSRPATLLPGLQSHRLGDRDAAATACLAEGLPAVPLLTDPPGPRLRQGRLGSGWPSSFRCQLGLPGATQGCRGPSLLAPIRRLETGCPGGSGGRWAIAGRPCLWVP